MMQKHKWLSKLRRFFFTMETSSTQETRRKWFFGGPKTSKPASAIIPPPLPSTRRLLQDKVHDKTIYELASIKIQTAYRRHLARKALRALKGLVKLQAIIRGRNVRRKAMNTLKCLQSIVNIQTRVCARRSQSFEENFDFQEKATQKIESANHIRWDDKILTRREESEALFFKKHHVNRPDQTLKAHALELRNSTDQEYHKVSTKKSMRPWLEEWADKQSLKMEDHKVSTRPMSHNHITRELGRKRLNFGTRHQKHRLEGLVSPKYMAPTESAKAKARSRSSLRIRTLSFDTYSEGSNNSPYKNKLAASDISSVVTISDGIMRKDECRGLHCTLSSSKGISGALRPRRRAKDVSFDSECSVLNWDLYGLSKL